MGHEKSKFYPCGNLLKRMKTVERNMREIRELTASLMKKNEMASRRDAS